MLERRAEARGGQQLSPSTAVSLVLSIPGTLTLVSLAYTLLTPGMDNTRHFYSITAVAGTV